MALAAQPWPAEVDTARNWIPAVCSGMISALRRFMSRRAGCRSSVQRSYATQSNACDSRLRSPGRWLMYCLAVQDPGVHVALQTGGHLTASVSESTGGDKSRAVVRGWCGGLLTMASVSYPVKPDAVPSATSRRPPVDELVHAWSYRYGGRATSPWALIPRRLTACKWCTDLSVRASTRPSSWIRTAFQRHVLQVDGFAGDGVCRAGRGGASVAGWRWRCSSAGGGRCSLTVAGGACIRINDRGQWAQLLLGAASQELGVAAGE